MGRIDRNTIHFEGSGGPEAVLIVGGTKIPVAVDSKLVGENFQISLLAHDEELESESYHLNSSGFELVMADGAMFSPPLPLLRFPMSTGDAWDWNGAVKEGDQSRPASAKVATSPDTLKLGASSLDTTKVRVMVSIESGTAVPASRNLTFWFDAKRGLLKREFGSGTSRMVSEQEG